MKTKTEFEAFWISNLELKLEKLRQAKLAINKRLSYKKYGYSVLVIFIALILLGPLFNKFRLENLLGPLIFVSILYSIFWPVVIFFRRNKATSPLEDEYVNTILPPIVSFINKDLKFEFDKGLSLVEFNKAGFVKEANFSNSKLLISGKRSGEAIRICGFTAQKKSTSTRRNTDSINSKTTTSTTTLFDGLFAIISLNRSFETSLTVKVQQFKASQEIPDFLKGLTQDEGEKALTSSVKTGNEAFDAEFEVICQNEWAARNLLNPIVQSNLLQFHKETGFCFGFKFSGNELFILSPIPAFFNSTLIFDFEKKENSELYFGYLNSTLGLLDIILPEESLPPRP